MSERIRFIYRDADGNISYRDIANVSKTEEYVQGYCTQTNGFRTFRKNRVLEYIDEETDVDDRLNYHIASQPLPEKQSPKRSKERSLRNSSPRLSNTFNAPEICFTGFKKEDKVRLAELAELSGMFVCASVTSQLVYLCCGYNAGPKKIEKSRYQGSIILSESQFLELLETGEIPEQ